MPDTSIGGEKFYFHSIKTIDIDQWKVLESVYHQNEGCNCYQEAL